MITRRARPARIAASKKDGLCAKADKLWSKVVHLEWRELCAFSVTDDNHTCKGPLDPHHLISKHIHHLRHVPENGMLMCRHGHEHSELSPHAHPVEFNAWLLKHYPGKYDWVHEHKNQNAKPDYEQAITILERMRKDYAKA